MRLDGMCAICCTGQKVVHVKRFSVNISMLVLSTITDIKDQNIVNACSQNLKSARCNVMVCAQSTR